MQILRLLVYKKNNDSINKKKDQHNMKELIKNILYKYQIAVIPVLFLLITIIYFIIQNNNASSLTGILNRGEQFEKNGKIAFALEEYKRAVRIYPNSYEAHVRLGKMFKEVDEPENAKLEFYRAIKISRINRYDAYFYMADIYVTENEYELAEHLLLQIKNAQLPLVKEKIGDFYTVWGDNFRTTNKLEAIRKYKDAVEFYAKSNKEKCLSRKHTIISTYIELSNLLLKSGNMQEAIKILNISNKYLNNANSHYSLGRIYQKYNIDKAIDEYTIAFQMNDKVADKDELIYLLLNKANTYKKNGDNISAKLYFTKASHFNPKIKIDKLADNKVIVNLIATIANNDKDNEFFTPGVTFKITNINQTALKYARAKAVFLIQGKKFSELTTKIIQPNDPLPAYSISSPISIYSPQPVSTLIPGIKIEILIYLSLSEKAEWRLYRTVYFEKNI